MGLSPWSLALGALVVVAPQVQAREGPETLIRVPDAGLLAFSLTVEILSILGGLASLCMLIYTKHWKTVLQLLVLIMTVFRLVFSCSLLLMIVVVNAITSDHELFVACAALKFIQFATIIAGSGVNAAIMFSYYTIVKQMSTQEGASCLWAGPW